MEWFNFSAAFDPVKQPLRKRPVESRLKRPSSGFSPSGSSARKLRLSSPSKCHVVWESRNWLYQHQARAALHMPRRPPKAILRMFTWPTPVPGRTGKAESLWDEPKAAA